MTPLRLAVLNPRGNDPAQTFPDFAGKPGAGPHPPVNLHAYAACTAGSFCRSPNQIPPDTQAVLLVLRRDLALCLRTLGELRACEVRIAVTVKESGLFQAGELLSRHLPLFEKICSAANSCIAGTPEMVSLYESAGANHVEFIPTPYPVDDPRWDFSIPIAERKGIFIGTRQFDVPSRNHVAAMLRARALSRAHSEPVTVINTDRSAGRRMLAGLGFPAGMLRVVEGELPYPDYLRLMAAHRIVFQLDRSAVPGQVAGDALLCRLPCVGGDSAIERLVFPNLASAPQTASELLTDPAFYEKTVADSRAAALDHLSFPTIATRLQSFFECKPGPGGN